LAFNTVISAQTISYLSTTISVFVAVQALQLTPETEADITDYAIRLSFPVAYPLLCFGVLLKYRDRLNEEFMKRKLENLYMNIQLNGHPLAPFAYVFFLGRRFLFVMVPYVLLGNGII